MDTAPQLYDATCSNHAYTWPVTFEKEALRASWRSLKVTYQSGYA